MRSSFVLLPEGEYPFTVTGFDRQNYDGSAKIPPCLMATLHLTVDGGSLGTTAVDERLYLHSTMEWKLSEFFYAIGQLKKNGTVRMNWNAVPGATGTVKLSVNEYTNKDGEIRRNNRVAKFLPPENGPAARLTPPPPPPAPVQAGPASAPAPQWQQPPAQQAMNGFQRQGRVADWQPEKY